VRVWETSYQRPGSTGRFGAGVSTSTRLVDRYRIEPEQVSTMGTGEALVVIKSPSASAHITQIRRPSPDIGR
jgi:hypothetical protein